MYKELVNMFFDHPQMRFRAICIKAAEINHERFITAYVADNSIDKITSSPKWGAEKQKNKKDAD